MLFSSSHTLCLVHVSYGALKVLGSLKFQQLHTPYSVKEDTCLLEEGEKALQGAAGQGLVKGGHHKLAFLCDDAYVHHGALRHIALTVHKHSLHTQCAIVSILALQPADS